MGAEARFNMITGFTQISEKLVIVADCSNYCLRLIDHTTRNTSEFSGLCKSCRYKGGVQAEYCGPIAVVIDQRDKNKLLVVDQYNEALRIVNLTSRAVGTFVKSE